MPTVYSSTGNQWPILQSKTEQKFKSGLLNASAEFIRPVGNTDLPSVIETSIGEVDVWPEPTVSVGTDGFERINATGYGGWDYNLSEATYAQSAANVLVSWSTLYQPNFQVKLPVILESVHVRKMGSAIPNPPSIRILTQTGEDITEKEFSSREFTTYGIEKKTKITKSIGMKMVKKNTFGTVVETEAAYEYTRAYLHFDFLYENA